MNDKRHPQEHKSCDVEKSHEENQSEALPKTRGSTAKIIALLSCVGALGYSCVTDIQCHVTSHSTAGEPRPLTSAESTPWFSPEEMRSKTNPSKLPAEGASDAD